LGWFGGAWLEREHTKQPHLTPALFQWTMGEGETAKHLNRTLKDAVKVFDVLGNIVLSSPACSVGTPSEGGHIRLDVSGLAAGV